MTGVSLTGEIDMAITSLLRPASATLIGIALAAATLVFPTASNAASAIDRYPVTVAEARAAIGATMKATGASSMTIALVDGNRVAWSDTFGAIDAAGTPPSATTEYGIGSVSKMLATIAMMQLVDQGKVSLDAPVVDYIPDFTMASPEYRQITVRMLLNHSAGLPGTDYANAFTPTPYTGYAEQVLTNLSTSRLKTTPGAMNVYCNDCFTLAGIVVERVSGMPFTKYVTDAILTPLGMSHSRYGTAPLTAGTFAPVLTDQGQLPAEITNIYASGGLLSTPADMSHLAMMLMDDGTYRGTRILSPSAVAQMATDQTRSTLNPILPAYMQYGLGWDTVAEAGLGEIGVTGWMKGGDTSQYHAAFTIAPDEHLAVIIQAAGMAIGSGTLETIGQVVLLNALAEKGAIAAVPEPVSSLGPAARKTTPGQVPAIAGTYLGQGLTLRIQTTPHGGITASTLINGTWVPSPDIYTLRSDGSYWSTTTPERSLRLARAWGRSYLVLRHPEGNGHYVTSMVVGQRVNPTAQLTPAWQARIDRNWLNVNELPDSAAWAGSMALKLTEIPGLTGYLLVGDPGAPSPVDPGTSDSVGRMFLVVPTALGRDLNDLVVIDRGGQEWLRFGGSVFRPQDGITALAMGTTTIPIGTEGYAEWRSVPTAGSVTVTGDTAWKLLNSDLAPIAAGTGAGSGIQAPAGSYLAVFGSPGAGVTVTVQ